MVYSITRLALAPSLNKAGFRCAVLATGLVVHGRRWLGGIANRAHASCNTQRYPEGEETAADAYGQGDSNGRRQPGGDGFL